MRVLNMAVPLASEGVTVDDNWDVLGMRGTASNDIVLDGRLRPAGARARQPTLRGDRSAPADHFASIGFSIISGVYLGVAEAAYAEPRWPPPRDTATT